MARIAIVFGLLLCGLSVAGMVATMIKDPVQFMPLLLGIPILFCGVVGLNPHRRRLSLWTAVIVGLIGVAMGVTEGIFMGVQRIDGEIVNPVGWRLTLVMTWLCVIFVVVTVIGMARARRGRKAELKRMANESIRAATTNESGDDDLPDAPVHRLATDEAMPMQSVASDRS